jgi:Lecithin retinol acyltransferase
VEEFALGCHLVSPRRTYFHHGIYIGEGKVIHYAGKSEDKTGADSSIRITTRENFCAGQGCTVRKHAQARFTGQQVVGRAKTRLGEDGYSLFGNNCEHFCNWAIDGVHESGQVEGGSVLTGSVLGGIVGIATPFAVAEIGRDVAVAGGAATMKGLATVGTLAGGAVGGIATVGGLAGAATATLVNLTLLAPHENHSAEEADARKAGRTATTVAVPIGTTAAVIAIGAAGAPGAVGAAAITSGLAGIGSLVGGGMLAGVGLTVAAPAVVTVAAGYGVYKLAQNSGELRDAIVMAADAPGTVAAKAADITKAAAAVAAPIIQDAALKAADTAKAGIQIAKDATTKAVPVVQNGANDILDAARSGAGSLVSAAEGAIEALTQNVEEKCGSAWEYIKTSITSSLRTTS